jgi:hypothetical protein
VKYFSVLDTDLLKSIKAPTPTLRNADADNDNDESTVVGETI